MVSTGSIEYIKNSELQSELSNYYIFIYSLLKNAIDTDNRSFLRFGDKLTDYKLDSIDYGAIGGTLTKHYFDPSDIIKIRKELDKLTSTLPWVWGESCDEIQIRKSLLITILPKYGFQDVTEEEISEVLEALSQA